MLNENIITIGAEILPQIVNQVKKIDNVLWSGAAGKQAGGYVLVYNMGFSWVWNNFKSTDNGENFYIIFFHRINLYGD